MVGDLFGSMSVPERVFSLGVTLPVELKLYELILDGISTFLKKAVL